MCVRVDYSDDGAVSWSIFTFEWETCFLAATPKHKFPDTCSYRIDCDHRLPDWLKILIERLHNHQFSPVK
jgi:hypothetical protein